MAMKEIKARGNIIGELVLKPQAWEHIKIMTRIEIFNKLLKIMTEEKDTG